MAEMCPITKVNYSVVFFILLFLVVFSLLRDRIFKKMENFTTLKNKNKKQDKKPEKCPNFLQSIVLIIKNILHGNIFPSTKDTKEELKKEVDNIKKYCRYERVNILSKYYLLVLKDKLVLF